MIRRSRSRGSITIPGPTCSQWVKDRNCNDPETKLGDYATCLVGSYQQTSDVVVPRFAERAAKGEVFFNPYSSVKQDSFIDQDGDGPAYITTGALKSCTSPVKYQAGHYDGPWLAYLYSSGTAIPVTGCVSESQISNLQKEISTKVLAQRGKASNNLFESVAEYKQALGMLSGPVKAVHKLLNKSQGLMRVMRPDEAYLVFQFGVKPLMNDISGIISGLELPKGKLRQSTRAKGEILGHDTKTSYVNGFAGWANMTLTNVISDSVHVSAVSLDEFVADTAFNVGFSLKGLMSTPYQLIAYSFVLDYFTSVGDFLDAYLPALGFKQLGSCLVTYREIENVITATNTVAADPTRFTCTRPLSGELRSRLVRKNRGPLTPAKVVIRTDFKFSSNQRVANLVSLLAQRILTTFGDPALYLNVANFSKGKGRQLTVRRRKKG